MPRYCEDPVEKLAQNLSKMALRLEGGMRHGERQSRRADLQMKLIDDDDDVCIYEMISLFGDEGR